MAQPAQLAHILASSPYQEYGPDVRRTISSPCDSPASDARYFPTSANLNHSQSSDSDETGYSYSSPPSSAQSSANTSYSSHFYDCYQPQVGQEAHYAYPQSSPLASDMSGSIYNPAQHANAYSQPMQSHVSLGGPLPVHQAQMAPLGHLQQLPPIPYAGATYGGMDTSVFRQQLGDLPPIQAPRASAIPGLSMDRPAVKRSKTAPGQILSSPPSSTGTAITLTAAPTRKPINPNREKRPAGKNGEDVWPEEVEIAFFECELPCA